jgi:hypothetical protein
LTEVCVWFAGGVGWRCGKDPSDVHENIPDVHDNNMQEAQDSLPGIGRALLSFHSE